MNRVERRRVSSPRIGFTIVELLTVVAIITLLLGVLLPAVGRARSTAKQSVSAVNLRSLGQAHATYSSEWNDRQFTLALDDLSRYGNNPSMAAVKYQMASNRYPPAILLGWGSDEGIGFGLYGYWMETPDNQVLMQPIDFEYGSGFGWFRIPNAAQYHQYVGGKYYDQVFYAPKDETAFSRLDACFESPDQFNDCMDSKAAPVSQHCPDEPGPLSVDKTVWSSYCLSPAALVNPTVLSSKGYTDPWSMKAGFRTPGSSQAKFSDLKTHLIEHHWLQNKRAECNPGVEDGTYDGCEPYYFNHSVMSAPVSLFYDGHVESIGVTEAIRSDSASGGLWSRDVAAYGTNGYFQDVAYDTGAGPGNGTSFHIFTTDGIRGRDIVAR